MFASGAARDPHHFLSVTKQGISAIVATDGNDSCHPILRGSTVGPNYHDMDIQRLGVSLEKAGLGNRVMIDTTVQLVRDNYRQRGIRAQEDITTLLGEAGAELVNVDTASDPIAVLSSFFRMRRSTPR